MWMNDTTYAVHRIEAGIASGANLNFVQDFWVKQEYDQVENEVWMLTRDELVVDLNVIPNKARRTRTPIQGFYGRRTATYRISRSISPRTTPSMKVWSEVVVEIDPLSLGADYWDQHRHVQLTQRENDIYHMVDTMKTIPKFRTYLDIISTVVTGFYVTGPIEIGPYFNVFSFNPVEGCALPHRRRTSNAFSTIGWSSKASLLMELKDQEFKYGLARPRLHQQGTPPALGAYYTHDVEQLGQSINAFRQDNILSSLPSAATPNTKLTFGGRVEG
jgi:hypothetical protein